MLCHLSRNSSNFLLATTSRFHLFWPPRSSLIKVTSQGVHHTQPAHTQKWQMKRYQDHDVMTSEKHLELAEYQKSARIKITLDTRALQTQRRKCEAGCAIWGRGLINCPALKTVPDTNRPPSLSVCAGAGVGGKHKKTVAHILAPSGSACATEYKNVNNKQIAALSTWTAKIKNPNVSLLIAIVLACRSVCQVF